MPRAYRERDFDEMAGRVVDRFMSGGTKLANAVAEEAMGGQLNPDQIERLVQAANTMAFLRMMEQRKSEGAGDLMHEFDPAETHGVLQQILGQTPQMGAPEEGVHQEPDGDEWSPLPDEMTARRQGAPEGLIGHQDHPGMPGAPEATEAPPHAEPDGDEGHDGPKLPPMDEDNDGPFPKGEKQKSKDESESKEKKKPAKAPEKDEEKEAAFRAMRLRKLADLLDDQFRQAEFAFEDAYADLSRSLKRAHGATKLAELEADAIALDDGVHVASVLNLLREERGLEPMSLSTVREKHASARDHRVVEETEDLRRVETLAKIAEEADKLQRAAEFARAQCA